MPQLGFLSWCGLGCHSPSLCSRVRAFTVFPTTHAWKPDPTAESGEVSHDELSHTAGSRLLARGVPCETMAGFCLPSWAGTEVDPHRASVSALDFPASCTGEDVSAPWRCLALCFLGSVTTAYSGFRDRLPSSSFRGHSKMSTPIAPVCLRDASHQPGKVALTLWEWGISQPPKPQKQRERAGSWKLIPNKGARLFWWTQIKRCPR